MAASEQTKKHFLALDQKRARKNMKIYSPIENNVNRNSEAISLRFIYKNDILKISYYSQENTCGGVSV